VPKTPTAPPVAAAPEVPLGDDQSSETIKPVPADKAAAKSSPKAEPKPKPKPEPTVKPAAKRPSSPIVKEVPRKSTGGQVNAWVVQVGSFAARNNARALRDKLRKQGYTSFVESIRGEAGRVYRVRVGPELTKAAADKLQVRLTKEAGLKGLVQTYP
jgi:DedD protein